MISVLLFFGAGEIALRGLYRDAGRKTAGGPGGRNFVYLFITGEQRARFVTTPRRPGIPRIMIFGDSITYGQGVHDWRALWPERLARALEQEGWPHDLAVLGYPGRNLPEHLAELERWGHKIQPDLLIYQWHVNDIEGLEQRPSTTRSWQRWRLHPHLRELSYLYYFLDNRLMTLTPPPGRTYFDYLVQEFKPGTKPWVEFERVFHNFAMRAKEIAARRLMVLYPQVPFRGSYPLQTLHDQMKMVAGPHTLAIPASSWVLKAGRLEPDADAARPYVVHVPAGTLGPVLETHEYFTGEGPVNLVLQLACDGVGSAVNIGALEVIDSVTGRPIDRVNVMTDARAQGWQRHSLQVVVKGTGTHPVRFRFASSGSAALSLASLEIPVDYDIHVIDLTEPLNTFDTHVSIFDAHPNERAHEVIAREVFKWLH